jgi:8-oxo-dGTP pyrophosphatase MutT (NUDIX family)
MSRPGETNPSGGQARPEARDRRPSVRGPARAGPGEEYNPGPATVPRQAATVILLRGGAQVLEVLLVRRTPAARFMGGVWVFPGGAVDAGDMPPGQDKRPGQEAPGAGRSGAIEAHALRAAAMRELREEAGISLLDPGELIEFSRWITPAKVRMRFDTHFFLAPLPAGQEPRIDGEECVDLGWFTPGDALAAHGSSEIELVFPTIKHLEQLGSFSSVEALLAHARGREVLPVEPRVVLDGEIARVLLPGDPGY